MRITNFQYPIPTAAHFQREFAQGSFVSFRDPFLPEIPQQPRHDRGRRREGGKEWVECPTGRKQVLRIFLSYIPSFLLVNATGERKLLEITNQLSRVMIEHWSKPPAMISLLLKRISAQWTFGLVSLFLPFGAAIEQNRKRAVAQTSRETTTNPRPPRYCSARQWNRAEVARITVGIFRSPIHPCTCIHTHTSLVSFNRTLWRFHVN